MIEDQPSEYDNSALKRKRKLENLKLNFIDKIVIGIFNFIVKYQMKF
jgi:hypothetical protein